MLTDRLPIAPLLPSCCPILYRLYWDAGLAGDVNSRKLETELDTVAVFLLIRRDDVCNRENKLEKKVDDIEPTTFVGEIAQPAPRPLLL